MVTSLVVKALILLLELGDTIVGEISNLITDMTLKGATEPEIARAVKHSMVVIDAAKSLRAGVDWIFTLPPVGMTTTWSPSKSAPERRSATLGYDFERRY